MPCMISADNINKTIEFHGHSCPGLAIGIRATELAMRELGMPDDIELVAITETDMCGVDAIQFLTNCTFGKGNFIHHDYGKMAFSFYDRQTGKGFRATLNHDARPIDNQLGTLMGKESDGTATKSEIKQIRDLKKALQEQFMDIELEDMFSVTWLDDGPPRPARVLESLVCAGCGESVMESRTRRFGGETFCIPCFGTKEQKI